MITQEKLHEVFEYRDNGNLVWKVRLSWRVQVGTIAGTVENNGYIRVTINGKPYRMHQLVFLYHF
jgi:hypothetical protein